MARPPWTVNSLTIAAGQSKTGTVQVYYAQPRAVFVPAGTQGGKLRFHFGAPIQATPTDPPTAGTFGPLVDGNGNMITVALTPGAWTDVRGLIPDTVFCQLETVGSDGSTPQTQSADRTLTLITAP